MSKKELVGLSDRDGLPFTEVAGFSVRCIASNVRVKENIPWHNFHAISGIGHEGNLVLGKVTSIGARHEMEYLYGEEIVDLPLQTGDLIVGVVANRHSGTSEYGDIPSDGLKVLEGGEVDLIAAGGIISRCLGVPNYLGNVPTEVKAVGLLAYPDGNLVDLRDFYPPWETELLPSAPLVLSLGTAAEIGKTTTAGEIIKELRNQGVERVAATKLAGTGRKRDITTLAKTGAEIAFDFPDVGLPTTYTSAERFIPATYTLLNKINRGTPQIIVAECGGDIIEGNIPTILTDPTIMKHVVAIIHSSTDALSIMGSLVLYEKWGILEKIPLYLTYPIKRNYFAIKARLKELNIKFPIFDPLNPEEISETVRNLLKN